MQTSLFRCTRRCQCLTAIAIGYYSISILFMLPFFVVVVVSCCFSSLISELQMHMHLFFCIAVNVESQISVLSSISFSPPHSHTHTHTPHITHSHIQFILLFISHTGMQTNCIYIFFPCAQFQHSIYCVVFG